MTLQDLTNNRELVISTIQAQMAFDAAAKKSMVKPVMDKMIAWLNREDVKAMPATKTNVKLFTVNVTNSWIKHDYKSSSTQFEIDQIEIKLENDRRGSHSSFY